MMWLAALLAVFAKGIDSQGFEQWRSGGEQWIRIGVQDPARKLRLSANSRLLVLDGTKVVDTIEPNGPFTVMIDRGLSASDSIWVQIQASRDTRTLLSTKASIQASYEGYRIEVFKSGETSMRTLKVGPCANFSDAKQLQARLRAGAFNDAFIVRVKAQTSLVWVNDNYDKFPLASNNLGLVSADPETPLGFGDRRYRGILWIRRQDDGLRVINELPLETYLRGVVPSELGPQVYPQLEAQKAQAVAARTYAIKNLGRYARSGYDLCDGPTCQAYFGAGYEHPLSDQAVAETRGLVLTYHGELIDALYTSTCGGHTEDVENVFPGRAEPYLRGKTSYILEDRSWSLPRIDPVSLGAVDHQDAQVRALVIGFPTPPAVDGVLQGSDLRAWLNDASWLLGSGPADIPQGPLTHRQFWTVLMNLDFVKAIIQRQVKAEDLTRVFGKGDSAGQAAFLNLARRFDTLTPAMQASIDSKAPISRIAGLRGLLEVIDTYGPNPDWSKYYIQEIVGRDLIVVRKGRERIIPMDRISYYVTKSDGDYRFLSDPRVTEGDIVYVLDGVLARPILDIRLNGVVASADHVSAFNYWIDKKTTAELEKRARRYISRLRGLRDVRVLSRSSTGRVTELEYIADSGRFKVTGLRIRWSLGVRDNLFDLVPAYRNKRLVHLTVVGRGWGHGVGMSQVGAFGLARNGWSFDRILTYYYTDVELIPYQALGQP